VDSNPVSSLVAGLSEERIDMMQRLLVGRTLPRGVASLPIDDSVTCANGASGALIASMLRRTR
jgi:hypothetical protein